MVFFGLARRGVNTIPTERSLTNQALQRLLAAAETIAFGRHPNMRKENHE